MLSLRLCVLHSRAGTTSALGFQERQARGRGPAFKRFSQVTSCRAGGVHGKQMPPGHLPALHGIGSEEGDDQVKSWGFSGKEAEGPCQIGMLWIPLCPLLQPCSLSPPIGAGGGKEPRAMRYPGGWRATGRGTLSTILHGVGEPAGLQIRDFLQELFSTKANRDSSGGVMPFNCCCPIPLLLGHCAPGLGQKAQGCSFA